MSPSRSFLALLTLVLVPWLGDARVGAQAAPLPPPPFEVSGCELDLARSVESALEVELSMAAPETTRGLADGSLRGLLVCDASGFLAVAMREAERLEQRVPRGEAALPRRLAVVLAELLEAASTRTLDAPPPIEPPAEPRPAALAFRLRLAGGVWLGGEPGLVLGAMELGAELAPLPEVALTAGISVAFGDVEVAAGRIDVRIVSGAASVRFGADLDALHLSAGPAVRGGAVVWTGHARDPARGVGADFVGGWLGVGAVAAAQLRAADLPLRIGLELEGGGVAFSSSALASGILAASVSGGWIEVRLAIDLRLG